MKPRRWEGRRFSDEERALAHQRVLEGATNLEVAAELNCSLHFLYRLFRRQKDRPRS
jgi:transposase-like protein